MRRAYKQMFDYYGMTHNTTLEGKVNNITD